jgi:hypothetical protein
MQTEPYNLVRTNWPAFDQLQCGGCAKHFRCAGCSWPDDLNPSRQDLLDVVAGQERQRFHANTLVCLVQPQEEEVGSVYFEQLIRLLSMRYFGGST